MLKMQTDKRTVVKRYIDDTFDGPERLQKIICHDFFSRGFDGSGADNFYDAGLFDWKRSDLAELGSFVLNLQLLTVFVIVDIFSEGSAFNNFNHQSFFPTFFFYRLNCVATYRFLY